MLALTRKRGESIMIGDNVEIIIIGIQNDQVKLGIVAPREVSIHRKEIFERIQEENKQAAVASDDSVAALRRLAEERGVK